MNKRPSSSRAARFRAPVVILAGGIKGEDGASIEAARTLFLSALSGFAGTLISGGTTSGIAGVAGDLAMACPRAEVIGYLPRRHGKNRPDRRYSRLCATPGKGFSAAECLRYWSDLIAAGVNPATVALLGWGGGRIAAFEYRIALMIGARVGIFAGTGRSADDLRRDPVWANAPRLRYLPWDAAAVRAFVNAAV
ncbi:MAG TPA: hypothetical protein VLT83_11540 [Opitutaceae bacterium]|nr:hypothetical protein [Opitutaceae bacterium]